MSFRHPMAAIKETTNQKVREIVVGHAADVIANAVLRNLEASGEAGVVFIKRTKQQGWPGHFIADVGKLVELTLQANNTSLNFDATASKDASQVPTEHGYGNPLRPDWRKDAVAFVFSQPVVAEVIQLDPGDSTELIRLQHAA